MLAYDFLEPIQNESEWSIQVDSTGRLATVRSLIWQGYVAYHHLKSSSCGGVYFGNGIKGVDVPFFIWRCLRIYLIILFYAFIHIIYNIFINLNGHIVRRTQNREPYKWICGQCPGASRGNFVRIASSWVLLTKAQVPGSSIVLKLSIRAQNWWDDHKQGGEGDSLVVGKPGEW